MAGKRLAPTPLAEPHASCSPNLSYHAAFCFFLRAGLHPTIHPFNYLDILTRLHTTRLHLFLGLGNDKMTDPRATVNHRPLVTSNNWGKQRHSIDTNNQASGIRKGSLIRDNSSCSSLLLLFMLDTITKCKETCKLACVS